MSCVSYMLISSFTPTTTRYFTLSQEFSLKSIRTAGKLIRYNGVALAAAGLVGGLAASFQCEKREKTSGVEKKKEKEKEKEKASA